MNGDKDTISDRSREVRNRIRELLTSLGEGNGSSNVRKAVEDAMHRLALWGGNLGVFRAPSSRLSLDSRLLKADAMDIHEEVMRQLDDILEAIQDLFDVLGTGKDDTGMVEDVSAADVGQPDSITNEEAPPISEDDYIDETSIIADIISQSITSLLRLGILIRKASPRDKFKEAQRSTRTRIPDHYDIEYVKMKHPKLNDAQGTRLGRAIAKRRQFILYCREHQARLAHDVDGSGDGTGTEVLSSKASTFLAPEKESFSSMHIDEEDDAISIMTASTMSDVSVSRKLPSLTDLSPDDEPFVCPICFSLQSFKSDRAWQTHAYRDLRAYTCTYGDESCDDRLFGDRESWFEHEMSQHRASFRCILCHRTMASKAHLRSHARDQHGLAFEQLDDIEFSSWQTSSIFTAQDCPFCEEWALTLRSRHNKKGKGTAHEDAPTSIAVSARRFKRHVGRHHEQLAIFAVPLNFDNDDDVGSSDTRSSCGSVAAECRAMHTVEPDFNTDSPFNGGPHGPPYGLGGLQFYHSSDGGPEPNHDETRRSFDQSSDTERPSSISASPGSVGEATEQHRWRDPTRLGDPPPRPQIHMARERRSRETVEYYGFPRGATNGDLRLLLGKSQPHKPPNKGDTGPIDSADDHEHEPPRG